MEPMDEKPRQEYKDYDKGVDHRQAGNNNYQSSSVVKATARREDHVTVCKYTRQEVAQ